ncbi:uncharacterized protein Pyn_29065 [Prunus yedoensis var. nudiflora]|uniref:DUF7722 domain-containing protein n=1 Tax=Prunus yedoensis var. nudiflora TaxID=2094558 RepID=A0A314XU55_PRUYE|nr:uncharacterized protein Pyn_29065 [Prunus yedoensis var. nudiflora]
MAAALSWLLHSACHVLLYPKVDSDSNRVMGNPNPSNNIEGDHHPSGSGSDSGGDHVMKKVVSNYSNKSAEIMHSSGSGSGGFQMPLHYPRYTKADYEKMEEWKVDLLLKQYGLAFQGTLDQKRAYAIGAFLWPDQY